MRAGAMSNAETEPASPWIAHVLTKVSASGWSDACTGTVIGNRWVLTAAHCIYNNDYTTRYGLDKITVNLGRPNGNNPKSGGVNLKVDRAVVMPGYPQVRANDALLLRLVGFDETRWNAVPIARERWVVNGPVTLTLFGYGNTRWKNETETIGGGQLRKSPQGAFLRSPGCDGRFICIQPTDKTKALHGDSGGPVMRWVSGAWQIIGVASNVDNLTRSGKQGPLRAVGALSAAAPSKILLEWVRTVANLPRPGANTIVRNSRNGASWLVGADGYRRWIPTGGDWLCHTGRGAPVVNLDQVSIDSIPDRVGEHAICAQPPPIVDGTPQPPTPDPGTPRPVAANLTAVNNGGGHVGVAFDVGWQSGRDPVTCRFYRNGAEVFAAQCGTRSSKQFYGLPPGAHTFYATVTDRFGVVSAPTNSVTVNVAAPPPPPAPTRRAIVVDNRVTDGMGMREDTTPVRLTTQPWIRCGSRGCNINGTEAGSGHVYDAAVCQTTGERTTNGHDTSAADDANPLRFESTRYYGVRLTNGVFGYISEVWIRAADRGGLGLPGC